MRKVLHGVHAVDEDTEKSWNYVRGSSLHKEKDASVSIKDERAHKRRNFHTKGCLHETMSHEPRNSTDYVRIHKLSHFK